jgi:hypothetical protein
VTLICEIFTQAGQLNYDNGEHSKKDDKENEKSNGSKPGKTSRSFGKLSLGFSTKKNRRNTGEHQDQVDASLRASSQRCKIMTKMSVGLVLNVAYFAIILFVSFETAAAVRDSPYESNFSGLRRSQLRITTHQLRMYGTGEELYGGYSVNYVSFPPPWHPPPSPHPNHATVPQLRQHL